MREEKRANGEKRKWNRTELARELRAACLNKEALANTSEKWVLETPYAVRRGAMDDLFKAYDTVFAKRTPKFKMRFRSSKAPTQSIEIVHAKLQEGHVLSKVLRLAAPARRTSAARRRELRHALGPHRASVSTTCASPEPLAVPAREPRAGDFH